MASSARSSRNSSAARSALVARPGRKPARLPWWLPLGARGLVEELDERAQRLPTRLNEYGYDPFGYDPTWTTTLTLPMALLYRRWFRTEAHAVQNVPEGRVMLIANHAGNTFAFDGAMLSMALFLEREPPRIARGMAEYYLPTIPFFNIALQRSGSVVGTPENCIELLEHDEAVMVFPEGQRGFVKPHAQAYQLQEFGLGFMRMALETGSPIVPVGIVGSEEHSPGLARAERLGRLMGAPAIPITLTFPWLGPLGFLPLPVKFHLHFGEALVFDGDANDDDASVRVHVEVVMERIRELIQLGLDARSGWFS